MTLSDLTSKTPEELNVMCAELCGYERQGAERIWWNREQGHYFGAADLPNYTGSWDAIMPPVSALSETDYEVFANWLFGIVWSDGMSEREHDRAFDTACPLNRTIALILTLTK